jgi:hypothetical protein
MLRIALTMRALTMPRVPLITCPSRMTSA